MITTFYSFKGGVGRSMAMANVAYELASRGLRVLAIDFDLEAPGLERYFRVPMSTVHATPGVIDLIEQYKRALSGSGDIGPEAEFRQLPRYICPIAEFGGAGRLDLMPAGRRASDDDRRAYALAVRTFDWQDFYFNWEGEAFFEWLRRQLVGSGAGDGSSKDGLYDIVLADSRTGVTEMGGVCACQLADVVVMLTAANHQNIEGTRELAADLGSAAVRTLRRSRPPLQIVVVPARVEQRAPELLDDFITRFDAAFGGERPEAFAEIGLAFHDLALPYVPEFAFEEQVTERSSAEAGVLTDAFRRLSDALLLLAGPRLPAEHRETARRALQRTPEGGLKVSAAAPERAFDPSSRFAGFDALLSAPLAARTGAQQLAGWLAEEPRALRVQLADSAPPGSTRELPQSAAELLHHAQALVLLVDDSGVSPWQRAEVSLARSLPRSPRLVLVLLPGAADDAFTLAFGQSLSDSPVIDLRGGIDDRNALTLLLAALRPGAETDRAETTVTGGAELACPFPGAAAFGESDAALFGGRSEALAQLLAALQAGRRVLLQGPAGCGKTSLVMAGLWPALRQAGRHALHHIDLRHSEGRPWSREATALDRDALLVIDHADEGSRADLVKLAALCKDDAGPALLVVWRAAPLALAEIDQLAGWKDAPARAATQRGHALHHGGPPGARAMLAEALAGLPSVTLAALDTRALRAAIDTLLAQAGRRAETGLLERLLADLGEQPSMSVAQRTLAALWPLQARGWLTNEAYERIGGVDRLVCQGLEAVLAPADGVARAALDALLQRLVHTSTDGVLVARTMDWSRECSLPAVAGQAAAAAQRLAQAGLLRVMADGEAADATIDLRLAHLPRRCPLLSTLAAPPQVARAHGVARAYAAWADGASDDAADAVIEDTDLAPLRPWLSLGEAGYANALQVVQRREARRRRLVAASLAGCLVLAVAVGVWRTRSAQADAAVQAQAASAAVATADVAREQVKRVQETPVDPATPSTAPAPGTPTRVVVHRSGDSPEDAALARALVDALPADRYRVDRDIDAVTLEICGDVRFHQPQDVERARDAVDRLNQALAGRGDVRRLELNDRTQTRGALPSRAGTIEVWLPPMSPAPATRAHRWGESRLVPAGCAVVGSDAKGRASLRRALQADALAFYDTELPLRRVWLPAYYIGRHEVTMAQFAAFQQACERTGRCPPWRPRYVDPVKEPNRPAVFVSWRQADAYCRWAGGRLPSELQWEKAARGNDGRFWPWGEQPDDQRYQGKAQARRQPVAVGSFPAGDSPYGVADMAGNVWELTADDWQGEGSGHTIRGGSYLNSLMESRASVRWATGAEDQGSEYLGFRCVADVNPPAATR